MIYIRLEHNDENVHINKIDSKFHITCTKEWKFLTQFTHARLIITYPGGEVVLPIDRRFINNQDYILTKDLDFNFIPIIPFGNANSGSIYPFTGTFDGNNFCMKNIEIKNNTNNGLFGIIKYGTIKNLTLQNIIIKTGKYNGCLVGKGFQVELHNIKIIGSVNINGYYNGGVGAMIEGNLKNITMCIEGSVNSIIAHDYSGTVENISVITNLHNNPGYFINISGVIKNSNIITFKKINNPFYINSNHHIISDCYYFQLDEDILPTMQMIENSYYRNLNKIVYSTKIDWENWIKIDTNYYLKNVINYIASVNDVIANDLYQDITFYNVHSNETNSNLYMNMEGTILYNSEVVTNPLNSIPSLQANISPTNGQKINVNSFTDYMKLRLERLKSM
jgi:hypothetical protein